MKTQNTSLIFLILSILILPESILANVIIVDNKLNINNEAFYIKGIAYHPVPKGNSGNQRSFKNIDKDLIKAYRLDIETLMENSINNK